MTFIYFITGNIQRRRPTRMGTFHLWCSYAIYVQNQCMSPKYIPLFKRKMYQPWFYLRWRKWLWRWFWWGRLIYMIFYHSWHLVNKAFIKTSFQIIFTSSNFKLGGPIGEPAFKKCEQDCKFHFESSGDTLKSINFPGHYQPFSDCKWTLEGPRGHRIVFQVTV